MVQDSTPNLPFDPIIPPVNSYGTITSSTRQILHSPSQSSFSSVSSSSSEAHLLLPGSIPWPTGVFGRVSGNLIPFSSVFGGLIWWCVNVSHRWGAHRTDVESGLPSDDQNLQAETAQRTWVASDGSSCVSFVNETVFLVFSNDFRVQNEYLTFTHHKHRPFIAGGGENLPLEITRSLSHWLSVLEERGSVPGGLAFCPICLTQSHLM